MALGSEVQSCVQAVRFTDDTVDNEFMNKKKSKSKDEALGKNCVPESAVQCISSDQTSLCCRVLYLSQAEELWELERQ